MLRRAFFALLNASLALAALAYAAAPGPHRAATPTLWGLEKPAPKLYTDAPERAAAFQALIAEAEAETEAFFGVLERDPVWVICTTARCQDDFGFRSNGLALGAHFILIGPKGISAMIFTHERVHIALHNYLGPSDLLDPRFPAWFDEGLAAHLSGDTRLYQPDDPRAADWIRLARRLSDWNRIRPTRDWRDRYGAAARLVREIEETVGRDGLRRMIERVGGGADFDTEYAAALQN